MPVPGLSACEGVEFLAGRARQIGGYLVPR